MNLDDLSDKVLMSTYNLFYTYLLDMIAEFIVTSGGRSGPSGYPLPEQSVYDSYYFIMFARSSESNYMDKRL